jgi:hypothetical protein
VTPVPLELPLRPAEAADLANLIFDRAEGKPLFGDYHAALKISRGFDLELDAKGPMTPEFLRTTLESMRERGHSPQLVCPGPVAPEDLDEMAATARLFQITLSFRYRGEPEATVRAIAKATAGRLNYRVRTFSEAEFLAEHLL